MDRQAKIKALRATKILAVYEVEDIVDGSEKIAVVCRPLSKTYPADQFDRMSVQDVIDDMDALWDAQGYCGE